MSMQAVTLCKSDCEGGYAVRVPRADHLDRVFVWGTFDECTISWQAARAQAMGYAAAVSARLGLPLKVAALKAEEVGT